MSKKTKTPMKVLILDNNPDVIRLIKNYFIARYGDVAVDTAATSEELLLKMVASRTGEKQYAFVLADDSSVFGMRVLEAVAMYRQFEATMNDFGIRVGNEIPIYVHTNKNGGDFSQAIIEAGITGVVERGPETTYSGLDQVLKPYFKPKAQK